MTMTIDTTDKKNLMAIMADKFQMDAAELATTLKNTAFKIKEGTVSDSQMNALLVVANEYGLNPFLKQIYAYPDKGGIVPVVGVDGWVTIANNHPNYAGCEFKFSEKMVVMNKSKPCPEWCEVWIWRKDSERPIIVREYLDEVFRDLPYPNAWQTHPKRFLRHKTFIQGVRVALGLTGIYDEDEAERIIEGTARTVSSKPQSSSLNDRISAIANEKKESVIVDMAQPATVTPEVTPAPEPKAKEDMTEDERRKTAIDMINDYVEKHDKYDQLTVELDLLGCKLEEAPLIELRRIYSNFVKKSKGDAK